MKRLLRLLKRIVKKAAYYLLLSPVLKKTNWYKNLFVDDVYPGNKWYREHDERNFDLVTLGSSGAKWAYDFSDCGIKGMNWAQQPQTLVEDFNLLRNYHSILRNNGIVVITLMPFTSLNKKTGVRDALKYQKLDAQSPIQPYLYARARRITEMPMVMGKPALKALIKYLLGRDEKLRTRGNADLSHNVMTQEELESNAKSFVDGWKRQFGIADFDAPLTPENEEGRKFRLALVREIIDFCLERNYKPVMVIPPVTKHLSIYYTQRFKETYIYSFIREIQRDVPLLDYSKVEELQEDDLYFNSFFLNLKGRNIFTNRVLKDLGTI